MALSPFWQFAKRLLKHKGQLAAAMSLALVSAGGLGAGLVALSPVLEFLLRNKNQVITRTMLLEHVWEYHFDPQTNVIDVHISRLRQKIDRDPANSMIKTIRGAGYTMEDPQRNAA